MTSVELDMYFAKELRNIKELISEFNTFPCEKIATDLTRISAIFEFPTGVFVGEFLEDIFRELDDLKEYDLKDEDKKEILNKILDFVNYLLENPNILCNRNRYFPHDIIEKMIDLRYIVTKKQIEILRTKRRRRVLLPF